MRSHTLARVAAIAAAQHGVVTSAQLVEAGLDLRLPRTGCWQQLAPRTWAVNDDVDDVQLLQAIRLYAGEDAVPSGALACRRHRLRDVPGSTADALVSHGRTLLGGGRVRLHQTRRLPDPVVRDGWGIAPLPRAVADASRWSSSLQAVRGLVLAAVADRRTTAEALRVELDDGPRRGSAHLARALTDADRGASSAPEAEAADIALTLRGLVAFLLNPEIWLDGVLLGRPDGYLPELGLGWELDSLRHHGSSDDLARTLERHQAFSRAGIELLHVVPAVMRRDPGAWATALTARARARAGWTQPRGLAVVPAGPLLVPRGSLAA